MVTEGKDASGDGSNGAATDFPDSLDWIPMGQPTGPITEVIPLSAPQSADRIGVVTVQSASSFPVSAGPTRAALATDLVTCPECGQMATVDMARRQAEDFCRNCDYPLFWANSTVIAPSGEDTGASLRRLPGTVGRAATASLLCPHCGEPNSPAAQICIRCALSLHPVEIPEPEPVIVIPEPEPEPEPPPPEPAFEWWWVALIGICIAILAIMIIWAVTT
jgi:predicted RNA-binding Zn-ribbon protein involved in translation (DUF1610 family)